VSGARSAGWLRDVRVCVFGDSFVVGVGDPKALGWVGRVAARTPPSTGVALTVYPLGVRGERTADVVVRVPVESAARFARGNEHAVVLAVGLGDALGEVEPARSAATLEFGLASTTARRLVVGPPPVGDPDVRERIARLDETYAAVCERLEVPYICTYGPLADHPPWLDEPLADGVHPGQAGYGMLAYVVLHGGWYEWLGVQPPEGRRRHARVTP
jgi:acyl-CoA thioesterase I